MTLIFTIALAATLIVIVLVLVGIIIYQRWRIGDQNVFIERFIRQNEGCAKRCVNQEFFKITIIQINNEKID